MKFTPQLDEQLHAPSLPEGAYEAKIIHFSAHENEIGHGFFKCEMQVFKDGSPTTSTILDAYIPYHTPNPAFKMWKLSSFCKSCDIYEEYKRGELNEEEVLYKMIYILVEHKQEEYISKKTGNHVKKTLAKVKAYIAKEEFDEKSKEASEVPFIDDDIPFL